MRWIPRLVPCLFPSQGMSEYHTPQSSCLFNEPCRGALPAESEWMDGRHSWGCSSIPPCRFVPLPFLR
ncbi:hypothetical protein L249_1608, partial [Ophiocordyceps polyrhachis-furcata BCC 54312]